MSELKEEDLIQFWKDANSYQSIDVACFDIEEFQYNWIRDKIGHEALEQANGVLNNHEQALPIQHVRQALIAFRTFWWGNREKIDDITNNDIERYLGNL